MKMLKDKKIYICFFSMITVNILFLLLFFHVQHFVVLIMTSTVNILILYLTINHIGKRLEIISKNVEENINGNNESEIYEEGIIGSISNQINNLHKRNLFMYEQSKLEKENIVKLITEISHQVKTPIGSLQVLNELMLDNDESKRKEVNQLMKNELSRLQWLSYFLFDISKLECGMINLKFTGVKASELIRKSIESVYTKYLEKDIELYGEIVNDFAMDGDKKWLHETLTNILDNAIKYSECNTTVTISTKVTPLDKRIIITDEGKGINREHLSKIFNRFYKIDNETEGVGVGLYLAKQIMRLHGGTIKVSSEVGKGSAFEVIFYEK
ncbi:HAMP domain-containing histidine kinase [Mycoplasmatota bacterium]|nr:HAMP domain-containing histidine kinase [Mycoplasmatota bacterium]